jgi:hypothetical protein
MLSLRACILISNATIYKLVDFMFPRKSKGLIGNSIYIPWDESYFINFMLELSSGHMVFVVNWSRVHIKLLRPMQGVS